MEDELMEAEAIFAACKEDGVEAKGGLCCKLLTMPTTLLEATIRALVRIFPRQVNTVLSLHIIFDIDLMYILDETHDSESMGFQMAILLLHTSHPSLHLWLDIATREHELKYAFEMS